MNLSQNASKATRFLYNNIQDSDKIQTFRRFLFPRSFKGHTMETKTTPRSQYNDIIRQDASSFGVSHGRGNHKREQNFGDPTPV